MLNLTRQQQTVLILVLLLLASGWAVKTWRAAHPGDRENAGAPETPAAATAE